jgi:hypothetical protein
MQIRSNAKKKCEGKKIRGKSKPAEQKQHENAREMGEMQCCMLVKRDIGS